MKATIWISGRTCRIIIEDAENQIVDLCDVWNNIASAQSWLFDVYPEANQNVIRDRTKIPDLDTRWIQLRKNTP